MSRFELVYSESMSVVQNGSSALSSLGSYRCSLNCNWTVRTNVAQVLNTVCVGVGESCFRNQKKSRRSCPQHKSLDLAKRL